MKNFFGKLCLILFLATHNYTPTFAQTNSILVAGTSRSIDTSPTLVKLADVLKTFKTKFDADVLFEDKTIEGLVVSPDLVNLKESVEVNLNNLLNAFSLSYKKVKEKTYVIISKNKKGKSSNTTSSPVKIEIDNNIVGITPSKTVTNDLVITGTVRDDKNAYVSGVTIVEKGKANTVISRGDGTFSIKVSSTAAILIFSYEGFQSQEITIGNNTSLSIILKPSVKDLEQVVVVGYGTQKKKDITGAVSSVSKERLADLPNSNFEQALQGALPGVSVSTNSSSAEGSGNSILVRGKNSIKAGTEPLIILDGIPFTGSMSEINPNDLESIDVLKDASSAAIYGAKASGGVIILTTKQGKKGKVTVTYDAQIGVTEVAKKPDLMNGQEFYNFKINRANAVNTISASEQAVYDSKSWVNWYDLSTRHGIRNQHSISISGASDKTKYYFNASYLKVQGVAKGDQFGRYSIRSNYDFKIAPWISLGSNTNISVIDRSGIPVNFSNSTTGATFFNPLTTPSNPDGSLTISAWPDGEPSYGNPLSTTLVTNNDLTYKLFTGNNITVDIPFIKGLSYKFNTGVELSNTVNKTFYGLNTYNGVQNNGLAKDYQMTHRNFTIENIVNYSRTFGLHNVGVTGLYSAQSEDEAVDEYTGVNFGSAVLNSNGKFFQMDQAGTITATAPSTLTTFKKNTLSQMLRINYGYNSKYLLTLTARRDGFSAFGSGQKYGIFPAIAVGWNIKREKFMEDIDIFNSLKLRLSYGLNGNSNLAAYSSLVNVGKTANYLSGSATVLQGVYPSVLGNELLGWESSKVYDFGADFTILHQRITGSLDIYDKSSNHLILARAISPVQGFTSVIQNIGKVDNKGIELNLTTTNIQQKGFTWTTTANISYNNNKIVDLYGNGQNDTANQWFIGKPIDVVYGYKYAGVFQTGDKDTVQQQSGAQSAHPGYVKISLVGKDSVVNVNDKQIIGNTQPKFVWGIGNTFKYKNWSLYVFVRGVGNVIKENTLAQDAVGGSITENTTVKNWWTPTNNSTSHWANDANANLYHVGIYQNASFVRLQDITLSYEMPPTIINKLQLSRVKLYLTGRNLAVRTKFGGIDPELTSQISIPNQREFVLGLNVGF